MNAPDSSTPSEELEGTNVPEFHEELAKGIEHLKALNGSAAFLIVQHKVERRLFMLILSDGLKPPHGYEPIVKVALSKTGLEARTHENLSPAIKGAVFHALGYFWSKTIVERTKEGKVRGAKYRTAGAKLVATITPYRAGYSR